MTDDRFEITWKVDDGYAGGSRTHTFDISANELDPNMDDNELEQLFWDLIEDDFINSVHPHSDDKKAFLEWAKAKQQEIREEEDGA